jgi:hypothetical protein
VLPRGVSTVFGNGAVHRGSPKEEGKEVAHLLKCILNDQWALRGGSPTGIMWTKE